MTTREMKPLYEATFAQPLPADLGEPDPWAALPSYEWKTVAPFEFLVQGDQREVHGGTMALLANLVRVEQISRAGNQYFAHVDPDGRAPAEVWLQDTAGSWLYTPVADSRATLEETAGVAEELLFSEAFESVADASALAAAGDEARGELEPILERVAALNGRIAQCSEPALAPVYDAVARFVAPRTPWAYLRSQTHAAHFIDRARWIVELLVTGAPGLLASQPPPPPERSFGEVLADPRFGHSPPDALYWLFWGFFRDERDVLAAALPRCGASRSPMVASAASVVDRALRAPTALGSIADLRALRDAYLATQPRTP